MFVWNIVFCFCFKQKTAYEMRISDWSSDVCSSDLIAAVGRAMRAERERLGNFRRRQHCADRKTATKSLGGAHHVRRHAELFIRVQRAGAAVAGLYLVEQIGRAHV